jgi:uncharacterized CHY-type Zn-finger protein
MKFASPWEAERWKLQRLYGSSIVLREKPQSWVLELELKPSDPRLNSEGKYGFPSEGLRIVLSVPVGYTQSDSSNPRYFPVVESVSCTCLTEGILADIERKIIKSFTESCEFLNDLIIFNGFRRIDRIIPEIWIDSCLRFWSSPVPSGDFQDNQVARLDLSLPIRHRVTRYLLDMICTKCDRTMSNISIDALTGLKEFTTECTTCSRDILLIISGDGFYGMDVIISQIHSIDLCLLCDCGKDFSYIKATPPHKPFTASFVCGCPERLLSYTMNPKFFDPTTRFSPKLRPKEVTARLFKLGVPLPSYGTCKHFKKSFRWIKYPCCQDWYPCNECHDARVTDHECTPNSVTKMMCGYCSKDQDIAQFCISCDKPTIPISQQPQRKPHWRKNRR